MPQFTRIALNGVGVSEIRLLGFDLDLLRIGSVSEAALIKLINGGGKTTLITLLSAIFEPRVRYLNRDKRIFSKNFKGSRMGVVAVEMTIDGAPPDMFGDRPRQVVGYAARLRAGDEFERVYFHFRVTVRTGLDSLPIRREDERPTTVGGFRDLLGALRAEDPAAEVQDFSTITDWRSFVETDLNIDLAHSIHFMLDLNRQESGATSGILKRFERNEDFLDFLVDPIAAAAGDEERGLSEPVQGTLRSQASLVRTRDRRRFFSASAAVLDGVAAACALRRRAEAEAAEAGASYRAVLALAGGRAGALAARRGELDAERVRRKGRLEEIDKTLLRVAGETAWLEHRHAEMASAEAASRSGDAAKKADLADGALKTERARLDVEPILRAQDRIDALDRRIAQVDAPLSEARTVLADLGGRAAALFRPRLTEAAGAVTQAEARRGRASHEIRRISEEKGRAEGDRAAASGRAEEAGRRLERAEAARRVLVEKGVLADDRDPGEALADAAADSEGARAELRKAASRMDEARTARERASSAVVAAEGSVDEAGRKARAAEDALTRFRSELADVRSKDALRDVYGDEADPEDPALRKGLRDDLESATRRREGMRREIAERERLAEHIHVAGLLPPGSAVERTLEALRGARINAHWMPRYLIENRRSTEQIRLAIAAEPAKFSGVVVLGAEARECADVVASLSGDPSIDLPVRVSLDAEAAGGNGEAALTVLPADATYDPDAAEEERARLLAANEKAVIAVANLDTAAEAADEALRAVDAFLKLYPAGSLDDMNSDAADAAAKLKEAKECLEEAQEAAAAAESAYNASVEVHGSAAAAAEAAEGVERAIKEYVDRWHSGLAETRETLRQSREAEEAARGRLTLLAAAEQEAEAEAMAAEGAEGDVRRVRDRLLERFDAILERTDGAEPQEGDVLEEIEAAYAAQSEVVASLDVGGDLKSDRRNAVQEREHWTNVFRSRHSADLEGLPEEMRRTGVRGRAEEVPRLEREAEQATLERGRAEQAASTAHETLREVGLRTAGERREPSGGDFSDLAACDAGLAACENARLRLDAERRTAKDALDGTDAALAALAAEERAITTLRGQAGTIAHLVDVEVEADPDGAERAADDLAEEELRLRTALSRAYATVSDRRTREGREVGRYRSFLQERMEDRHCVDETRELLRRSEASLAEDAENLAAAQRDLVEACDDKIARADTEVDHCRAIVRGFFDRVYDRLRVAQRLSVIPPGLGDWSGQPFLLVNLNVDAGDYEAFVNRRIREWLDAAIAGRDAGEDRVPREHAPLLKVIVRAVLHDKATFSVMRPRTNWRLDRVPVSDLQLFSGGEKLLATLMLFFLRMRVGMEARHRTGGGDMFLLLDNPVGEMNATSLVRPVLDMAAKSGIQIIGLTGINDMSVMGLFPLVAFLRRRFTPSAAYAEVDKIERNTEGPSHEGAKVEVKR